MRSPCLFLTAVLALVAVTQSGCAIEEVRAADPATETSPEPEESATAAGAPSQDWPQWRGPRRDGRSGRGTIPWPETLTQVWTVDVGRGYSSPVVANDLVYLHEQHNGQEVMRSFQMEGGTEVWSSASLAVLSTFSGSLLDGLVGDETRALGGGPYSTPLVAGDVVYGLGFNGELEGRRVLDGSLLCKFKTRHPRPMHGNAMSPLFLAPDKVVVHVGGGRTGEVVAYSCADQKAIWSWEGDGSAYASPVLTEIDGSRQVVALTDRLGVGLAADSGQLLWQLPFSEDSNQSMITPVIHKDLVLFAGVRRGTLAVRPSRAGAGWEPRLVWQRPERTFHMSSPVLFQGMLVGLSDKQKGQLVALDAGSGEDRFVGEGRFAESASLVVVGEHLLVLSAEGELVVFDWHRNSLREIKRYRVSDTEVWAHLAVVGDLLLVRDADRLTAWRV